MTTIDDVIGGTVGRSRTVLDYSQTMKALVKEAKQPGFSAESWAPLAELIATDEFVRIGPFKDVMNWTEYVEFLTNWATSSEWDCVFKRLTETADVTFLELEEHSRVGDFSNVVNSTSVYEFNADNKIRYIGVYLQMELPGMTPSFDAAADSQ